MTNLQQYNNSSNKHDEWCGKTYEIISNMYQCESKRYILKTIQFSKIVSQEFKLDQTSKAYQALRA